MLLPQSVDILKDTINNLNNSTHYLVHILLSNSVWRCKQEVVTVPPIYRTGSCE